MSSTSPSTPMLPQVLIVDDDAAVRESLALLLESAGFKVESFASGLEFLNADPIRRGGCLILDIRMPGMDGPEVQAEMDRRGYCIPILYLTAHGDIPIAVAAIKRGAMDFLTKPVDGTLLIDRVKEAFAVNGKARECLAGLTERECQVMRLMVTGMTNKTIARRLGISHRTVEAHRARIFEKSGAANLIELLRWCEICSRASADPEPGPADANLA